MTEETKPTIKIDDKDYIVENLSDVAKQYIAQIQNIAKQEAELKNRLQQAEVSRAGFVTMLKEEVKK